MLHGHEKSGRGVEQEWRKEQKGGGEGDWFSSIPFTESSVCFVKLKYMQNTQTNDQDNHQPI